MYPHSLLFLIYLTILPKFCEPIINGQKISIQRVPYTVRGECKEVETDKKIVFTGTILTTSLILTHCKFYDTKLYKDHKIIPGISSITEYSGPTYTATPAAIHPLRNGTDYCLCTLKLNTPFKYGPQIQNAAFPRHGHSFGSTKLKYLVAGFGTTIDADDNEPRSSPDLRGVLAQENFDWCKTMYPEAYDNGNFMCLGMHNDELATSGDEGAPVILPEDKLIYGIVLNPPAPKSPDSSQVRSRLILKVRLARDWIDIQRYGVPISVVEKPENHTKRRF